MTRVILAIVLAAFATQAEAGPFGHHRRKNSACTSCQQPSAAMPAMRAIVEVGGADQARCQQEANTMASRRIRGHVGATIGRFEGVGFGSSPGCSTCTPEQYGHRGLSLSGDAVARGPDGWYRVRSWR